MRPPRFFAPLQSAPFYRGFHGLPFCRSDLRDRPMQSLDSEWYSSIYGL